MFDFNDSNAWGYHVLRSANIPARFQGMDFTDLSPYHNSKVVPLVQDWVRGTVGGDGIAKGGSPTTGKGLLMIGAPGQGKTTLALVAAQAVARGLTYDAMNLPPTQEKLPPRPQGQQVYYVSYPELLELSKRQFDNNITDEEAVLLDRIWARGPEVDRVKVLVLDDLGREHRTASQWAQSYFDNLLRLRFDAGLPTVVTSNVPRNQWTEVYGPRMDSFAKEAFTLLPIMAPEGDRRK